jgi:hypothetical protein
VRSEQRASIERSVQSSARSATARSTRRGLSFSVYKSDSLVEKFSVGENLNEKRDSSGRKTALRMTPAFLQQAAKKRMP